MSSSTTTYIERQPSGVDRSFINKLSGEQGARLSAEPIARQPIISSSVFGALLFVFVEIMFFSALFSSYFVIKRGRDISGDVSLPLVANGFNTAVLILSAVFLFLAGSALKAGNKQATKNHLLRAVVLGGFFVAFQMYLSVKLVGAGLTMLSSIFGGCYFLLVGAHIIHAAIGIVLMANLYLKIDQQKLELSALRGLSVYWLFVVGVWPVLYAQLYF